MNRDIVSQYMESRVTEMNIQAGGGNIREQLKKEMDHQLTLGGQWVVFHREILGRTPEVLCKKQIPTNKDKIHAFFHYNVRRIEDSYDQIMNLMPEVQDIKKRLEKYEKLTKNEKALMYEKLFSYCANVAIYNPKENKVSELYYGMPSPILEETCVEQERNAEIIEVIQNDCSFLSRK